jgi:hypothetical protein
MFLWSQIRRSSSMITVPEILLKSVELAGDRWKTRYSRLRKAIEGGLARPDELKVKWRPAGPSRRSDSGK